MTRPTIHLYGSFLLCLPVLIHGFATTAYTSISSQAAIAGPLIPSFLETRRASNSHFGALYASTTSSSASITASSNNQPLKGLKVAIVGGGPSGLLLSHRLLQAGASSISIFESRNDPRFLSNNRLEGRAYALGVGIRGRKAIRTVDEDLWETVKERGYESDRFTLCISSKLKFKLRDGPKTRKFWKKNDEMEQEPSLLMYQSDLCSALLEELERREQHYLGDLDLNFATKVTDVDIKNGIVQTINRRNIKEEDDGEMPYSHGPYDLIVGCDGVNSPVRTAMQSLAPPDTFQCEVKELPGEFKVARLSSMPPNLDPTSVALLLPTKGKITAFAEPTVNGGACILFAGRDVQDDALLSSDPDIFKDLTMESLVERFPLLEGAVGTEGNDIIQQLITQRPASASSVKCNIYHIDCAALCGDAAHATGGVSGNGLNSALLDSVVLSDCLESTFDPANKAESIQSALLSYSQKQVPEGLALYDLSFGSSGELSLIQRFSLIFANLLNFVFGGKFGIGQPQLQVQLAMSSRSFANIRRDREYAYSEKFPDDETFQKTLAELYMKKN